MKLSIFTKKVFAIAVFSAAICTNLASQNSENTFQKIPLLDSLTIEKAVTYFQVDNANLDGEGVDILKQHIASSKFFVLGENHHSTQVSKLTEGLVPIFDKSGYKAVAFEVGPLSAEKLIELSEIPDSTQARLKAFNSKYFTSSLGMSAIPMFNAVPDAAFLKAFAETDMEIWGIDQEFVFSVLFLGDDLVESKSNDPNYEEIKAAWTKAKETAETEFENYSGNVLTKIFTHADFQQFEKMFDSDDRYAQEVLKRLHETMTIYESAHAVRVDYIRSNFLRNYEAFEKEHKDARYFIKIGYRHAATTNFSHGTYDLGALTQEIANIENAESTNVIIPRATHDDKDYRDLVPSLLNFHKKDRWTLIDLKKLRNDLNSYKFQIIKHPDYQQLNSMIMGFDLLLIPPVDKTPIDNR